MSMATATNARLKPRRDRRSMKLGASPATSPSCQAYSARATRAVMGDTTPISSLMFQLLAIATERNRDLQTRWIRAMARLAQAQGAKGPALMQSDYRFDLILRAVEDDANRLYPFDDDKDVVALNLQIGLSRYWILSMYEALRIVEKGGPRDEGFAALFHKFTLLRVPLAKGQIASDAKLSTDLRLVPIGVGAHIEPAPYERGGYNPPMFLDAFSGSLGWEVIDTSTGGTQPIVRRALSDGLLNLYGGGTEPS